MPFLTAAGSILTSKAGLAVIGLLAFVIWLSAHDRAIVARTREECKAASLQAQLTESNRQILVLRSASDDAEKRAAVDDREIANLSKEVEKIRGDLGEARKKACDVPSAATGRLRNIR